VLRVVRGFGTGLRVRLGPVVLVGPALAAEPAGRETAGSGRLPVILLPVPVLAVPVLAVALLSVARIGPVSLIGAVATIGGRRGLAVVLGRRPVTERVVVPPLVAVARLVIRV